MTKYNYVGKHRKNDEKKSKRKKVNSVVLGALTVATISTVGSPANAQADTLTIPQVNEQFIKQQLTQNGFNVNIPNIDNIVRQVQEELNNFVSPIAGPSQYLTDQVNKAINSVIPGQGNFVNPLNNFSNGSSGSLTNSTQRDRAVSVAHQQVGKPYVYGASGPNSFDCSGLVQYVYNQIGVSLPRVSNAQLSSGSPVNSVSQLRPGDIVGYYGGGHVGVYIGNGNIIHAPESGQNVKIAPVNSMSISSMRTIL